MHPVKHFRTLAMYFCAALAVTLSVLTATAAVPVSSVMSSRLYGELQSSAPTDTIEAIVYLKRRGCS